MPNGRNTADRKPRKVPAFQGQVGTFSICSRIRYRLANDFSMSALFIAGLFQQGIQCSMGFFDLHPILFNRFFLFVLDAAVNAPQGDDKCSKGQQ